LVGIFFIKNHPDKKFIFISSIGIFISLIILKNFDRNDFILWVPFSLIIVYGIGYLAKNHRKIFLLISILLIIYSVPEILRNSLLSH
jgi:hypothetical protein